MIIGKTSYNNLQVARTTYYRNCEKKKRDLSIDVLYIDYFHFYIKNNKYNSRCLENIVIRSIKL